MGEALPWEKARGAHTRPDPSGRVWDGSEHRGLACWCPEKSVVGIFMPISQVSTPGLQDFLELPDQNP